MKSFVRVAWGEEIGFGYWDRMVKSIRNSVLIEGVDSCVVYSCGSNNTRMLTDLGFSVKEISPDPWHYGSRDHRIPTRRRCVVYRPWHYKFRLLLEAARDFDEIIYADWDVHLVFGSVEEAFQRLGESKGDLHLSAFHYNRSQRVPIRTGGMLTSIVPSGNWLHFRGAAFPSAVLEKLEVTEENLGWHDEIAISRVIDDLMGSRTYSEADWLNHFESPVMVQKDVNCPWPLVSDDGRVVIRVSPIPFLWERRFGRFSKQTWIMVRAIRTAAGVGSR